MNRKLIHILNQGGIAVIPTDTIYGIVGSALDPEVVEKIYFLRKRNKSKPMIVLISDISDLKKFNVRLSAADLKILKKNWPGEVSVIFNVILKKFQYLHRGNKTIAFRMPDSKKLRNLLKKTGPLVAPSANTEGNPPSETISEAKKYFGNKVDVYVDGGKISGKPSTLISLKEGQITVLREGRVKFF